MALRLASLNLMSGRSIRDGSFPPLAEALAGITLDADVLAVQEVDRYQSRSGRVDQAAVLASAMDAEHRFHENVRGMPGEHGWTPGSGAVAEHDRAPGYGVALLSRLPVREWHELRLEPGRGRFPILIPARPPRLLWIPDEPRAAIAAVLEEPRITVACTHVSFMPTRSPRHLRAVRDWLATLPGPRVLLGDLNLPPGPVRRIMSGWWPLVTGPTFPSPAPRIQLDHMLCSDPTLAVSAAGVQRMPVSDHCAVTATLQL